MMGVVVLASYGQKRTMYIHDHYILPTRPPTQRNNACHDN